MSLILIAAFAVSAAGFAEDLTKRIGVKTRLVAGLISGALLLYLFTITSIRIDVYGLNTLFLNLWITTLFLCIASAGLANAYNLIDGFNGLASMVGIISTAAIAIVAFKVGDLILMYSALTLICAVLGFFVWNYPRGLIFLGDGGAYLIGFVIASLSILLVHRNPMVSPWFALLVNAYPIIETLFTFWRRLFYQGKNPGLPDKAHLHTLIYRRFLHSVQNINQRTNEKKRKGNIYTIGNNKTAPYLWFFSSIATTLAISFWNKTTPLIISFIIYIIFYIYLYKSLLKKNRPWWILIKKKLLT
jgi:UDP-N-acetylmuramyl pentapeptide phosphotransferase/UDP-N-acetylglucosamine-1-phosphate transferase